MQENSDGTEKNQDIEMENIRSRPIPPQPIEENLFKNTDIGPYHVIIENRNLINGRKGLSRLHPMTMGRLIHGKLGFISKDIHKITKIGIDKLKITFNTYINANKLLNHTELNKDYKIYIPRSILFKKGIVRGIEHSLSENEILNNMEFHNMPNIKLTHVKRINRKIIENNETKYIPTQSVIITIRGQILPTHAFLHFVRCPVETFIPRVIQCKKCLRYGHNEIDCKGSARCETCGLNPNTHGLDQNNIIKPCPIKEKPICLYCKQGHKTTSTNQCPEFKSQQSIKEIMVKNNISFGEAKSKIANTNSYSTTVQQTISQPIPTSHKTESRKFQNQTIISTPSVAPKRQRLNHVQPNKEFYYQKLITPKQTPGGLIQSNPHKPTQQTSNNNETLHNDLDKNLINLITEITKIIIKELNAEKNIQIDDTIIKNILSKINFP